MSLICAIKRNGAVYMGADSFSQKDSGELHLRARPKIFKLGHFLMGAVGDAVLLQILEYEEFSKNMMSFEDSHKKDPLRFMIRVFIPAFREVLVDSYYWKEKAEKKITGEAIVAFGQNLYYISSDLEVFESYYSYGAIGAGRDVAIGVMGMNSLSSDCLGDPTDVLGIALDLAEKHITSVRAPFTFLTTLKE